MTDHIIYLTTNGPVLYGLATMATLGAFMLAGLLLYWLARWARKPKRVIGVDTSTRPDWTVMKTTVPYHASLRFTPDNHAADGKVTLSIGGQWQGEATVPVTPPAKANGGAHRLRYELVNGKGNFLDASECDACGGRFDDILSRSAPCPHCGKTGRHKNIVAAWREGKWVTPYEADRACSCAKSHSGSCVSPRASDKPVPSFNDLKRQMDELKALRESFATAAWFPAPALSDVLASILLKHGSRDSLTYKIGHALQQGAMDADAAIVEIVRDRDRLADALIKHTQSPEPDYKLPDGLAWSYGMHDRVWRALPRGPRVVSPEERTEQWLDAIKRMQSAPYVPSKPIAYDAVNESAVREAMKPQDAVEWKVDDAPASEKPAPKFNVGDRVGVIEARWESLGPNLLRYGKVKSIHPCGVLLLDNGYGWPDSWLERVTWKAPEGPNGERFVGIDNDYIDGEHIIINTRCVGDIMYMCASTHVARAFGRTEWMNAIIAKHRDGYEVVA